MTAQLAMPDCIDIINVRKNKNVKKLVFYPENKKVFVNVIKMFPSFYLFLTYGLLTKSLTLTK